MSNALVDALTRMYGPNEESAQSANTANALMDTLSKMYGLRGKAAAGALNATPGVANALMEALKIPGDVYAGRRPANVESAMPLLGLIAGGNIPAAALSKTGAQLGAMGGRLRRAKEQGYEMPFYRGEASGRAPSEYNSGAFFSRDKQYAQGFAAKGGAAEPREFALRVQKPLSFHADITIGDWAEIVRTAKTPAEAQRLVDMLPLGQPMSADDFLAAAKAQASEPLMGGSHAWQLLEKNTANPEQILKNAGFDAIDTGRDVRKLSGAGIRLTEAAFDPASVNKRNILASGAGGVAGYPLIPTED